LFGILDFEVALLEADFKRPALSLAARATTVFQEVLT